jgi:predicted RNA-binding protein
LAATYWLDLFTAQTWNEFLQAGGTVSGFKESRWSTVSKIKPGDFLLCYVIGISRWVGLLEVTSDPYKDVNRIWSKDIFPSRMKVKPIITLKLETAIPIRELQESLSYFKDLRRPNSWVGHFRGSPTREKFDDAQVIIAAMKNAVDHPVERLFDSKKLSRHRNTYNIKNIEITIPEKENENNASDLSDTRENVTHEEIQWLLLKLGQDLGLELWVAKNDKSKSFNGQKFGDLKRIRDELPIQFDAATNKTIELIDVLWLKGNAILAAFEVEHTTSIYSGLLRMSDLVAMQPNLNIKLYIVAPDIRREKVIEEINRPTFSKLGTPLNEHCRFIPYSSLKVKVENALKAGLMQYLKPEFINELAESCIT